MRMLSFAFSAVVLVACGGDTDGDSGTSEGTGTSETGEGGEVTYPQTSVEARFFVSGAFPAPAVDWQGEPGTFSLSAPVTGVSVDATTGVVSWDRSLPLGPSAIEVLVVTSAGQTPIALEVDNVFGGTFVGGYNFDPASQDLVNDFELTLCPSGGMGIVDGGSAETEGGWTRNGRQIVGMYRFDTQQGYALEVDLDHGTDRATLEGRWFSGVSPSEGKVAGAMVLAIDERCLDAAGDATGCDCPTAQPDLELLPVYGPGAAEGLPGTRYCNLPGGGPSDAVEANVWNRSLTGSPATTLTVAWGNEETTTVQIDPLPPGGLTRLTADIPAGCYGASVCTYTLTVDADDGVEEADEANNQASSFCSLPPG